MNFEKSEKGESFEKGPSPVFPIQERYLTEGGASCGIDTGNDENDLAVPGCSTSDY